MNKPIKPANSKIYKNVLPIKIAAKSKAVYNISCTGHDFGSNKILVVFNFNNGREDFEVCKIRLNIHIGPNLISLQSTSQWIKFDEIKAVSFLSYFL